jgi:biofilm protein TabA
MVLDQLSHARRYAALHPGFAAAFDWLARMPAELADGRHPIDGDLVFALVQTYETGPAAAKQFEAHRKHIDIQYLVRGSEHILATGIDGLEVAVPYSEEKDVLFFQEPKASTALRLDAGWFTLLFPQDAHKPGCQLDAPAGVKKVVVKVRT